MSDILSRILAGVLGDGGGRAMPGPMNQPGGEAPSPLGRPRLPAEEAGRDGGMMRDGPMGRDGGQMGGGLGSILGGLLGGGRGGASSPMPSGGGLGGLASGLGGMKGMALLALLAYLMRGQGGARGLTSLADQLRGAGLGDRVDSWVQDGPNGDVSPEELRRAIPPQALDQLSAATGEGQDEILSQLSRGLPGMVDRLTPRGRLPERDEELPEAEPDELLRPFGLGRRT
ncbi:YidB family protein [Falsiroseomonas ponticola]|uniref:YidB family protein n=1 Tax=Falsiroseomonas ponticola TaxID=2786951 RepID=UPI001931843F|nr:YidB family protein [Roseomonas ponticola]